VTELAQGLPVAFAAWVFAVGAVVGSFLNVVIARVPKGQSIVSPGSRCPRCGNAIRWYDNIPVVSWLVLRARCRRCGLPISVRYPLVELLTAVLAVAVVRQAGPTWAAVGYFVFAACLVALAYIDLDTWLLPHQITWPLLALGIISPLWNRELPFRDSAIGAAAGFAVFAAVALFGEKVLRRETMGWGDVWLLGGIGAWLGWPALLPVVLLSAVQGAVVGSLMLALRRGPESPPPSPLPEAPAPAEAAAPRPAEPEPPAPAEPAAPPPPEAASQGQDEDWVPPRHAVPYGPFLALGALEYLFLGNRLVMAWNHLMFRILS
jgi:leader peptidase (prepilin peptidase)/N-methyltransferase